MVQCQQWVDSAFNEEKENLSIRRRTMMCQRLPEEYEEKLLAFQSFVFKMQKDHGYIPSQIGNADQTPVWFDARSCFVSERTGENFHLLSFLKENVYPQSRSLTAYLFKHKTKDG